jgi:hypothetical protein
MTWLLALIDRGNGGIGTLVTVSLKALVAVKNESIGSYGSALVTTVVIKFVLGACTGVQANIPFASMVIPAGAPIS